jgi:hypothetical protein
VHNGSLFIGDPVAPDESKRPVMEIEEESAMDTVNVV